MRKNNVFSNNFTSSIVQEWDLVDTFILVWDPVDRELHLEADVDADGPNALCWRKVYDKKESPNYHPSCTYVDSTFPVSRLCYPRVKGIWYQCLKCSFSFHFIYICENTCMCMWQFWISIRNVFNIWREFLSIFLSIRP